MSLVGRMAQKQPQEQKDPSFLSKAGGFLKNIGIGVVKSFGETAARQMTNPLSPLSPLSKFPGVGDIIAEKIPEKVTLPILGETSIKYSKEPLKAAGQAGEDLLNVGLAGTGGAVRATLKEAGEITAKEAAKEIAKTTLATKAKNVLKDFGMGFGYGVSSELQNKDKTFGSVIKSGVESGAVATVAGPVIGTGLKVVGKTAGLVGRMASAGAEKLANTLEEKAGSSISKVENVTPTPTTILSTIGKSALKSEKPNPVRYYQDVVKPVQTSGQKIAEKTADAIRYVQKLPQKLETALLDKYAAVRRFQNKAEVAGIDTPNLLEMTQGAAYRAGGKAETRLDDYIAMRGKFGDEWKYVKEYSHYMDDLDRLAQGNIIAGNRTADDVEKSLHALTQDLTPEQLNKIKQGQNELQNFLNQELTNAVESGRLSKESYKAIKEAHPNYIPHNVLDFLDDGKTVQGVGKSFNVAKSGIEKAKGSSRAIDDIDNAVVDRLYRQNVLNEKNKTVKAVIDTGKNLGENGGFIKLEQPVKEIDIPKGLEKISYFNNGVKEEWLIPDDVGRALKNLDGQEASVAMKWLNNSIGGKIITAPARAIRTLATGLNPVFAIFSNPTRDLQTIALTSEAGADDIYRGLIKTITGREDQNLYRLAKESGALQGSIFKEGKVPEQILKDKLENQGFFSKVIRPDKAIEAAGQKMEEMTRMIVFKKALESGKTPMEAAKLARNATVDFGKSGTAVQVLNKVIPFLNARVQGASNLISAVKENPTKAVRALMWSAAYPATLLNAYNSKYDSYQNIPDYERRKYWIVMVGENKGKDFNGKAILIPHYIKIPKGEAQQAVSNVTERILNLGKEKFADSTTQFLGKVFGDFSPVTESSILPAGIQQLVETQSNYSFFQQKPIEPTYVRPTGKKSVRAQDVEPKYRYNAVTTSEIAKYIGKALNWSPSKIDYVLKTGVLQDVLRLYDIPIKGLKGESTFEKATSIPFFRTLVGASTAGKSQKAAVEKQQKIIQKNTQKIDRQLNRVTTGTIGLMGRMAK